MSRLMQVLSGFATLIFLPIILAIALIFAVLSNVEQATACTPPDPNTTWAWPTSSHDFAQEFTDGFPNRHYGVDFSGKDGDAVVASKAGRVIEAGGQTVKLQHQSEDYTTHKMQDDVQTWYVGLKNLKVTVGQNVKRGDQLGELNSRGLVADESNPMEVTGPHLHFVVWMNDPDEGHHERDPKDFLEEEQHDTGAGACGCRTGGPDGPLVGNDNQQKSFNYLTGKGYTQAQAAGVVGNMIVESFGVNPLEKQGEPYGDHTSSEDVLGYDGGWGIVQWTPPRKMINPSRDAGKEFTEIDTLEYQLNFLYRQLQGETAIPEAPAGAALKAAENVDQASDAFAGKFDRFDGHEDPSSPTYAERRKMAREVMAKFGGGTPGAPATGQDGCQVSGDISQVALSLAWPEDGHGNQRDDAKQVYLTAMAEHNKGPAAASNSPWTDCGVFVATVMRMTADPNYQERGTGSQIAYVRSHPEKYQIIEDPKSTAELQPGDIMLSDGHTYLFTGPHDHGYDSAAASWNGHVPEAEHWYPASGYIAVRVKR